MKKKFSELTEEDCRAICNNHTPYCYSNGVCPFYRVDSECPFGVHEEFLGARHKTEGEVEVPEEGK